MKKTVIQLCMVLFSMNIAYAQQNKGTLSPEERATALKILKETQTKLAKSIKNLETAQFEFKPGPDKWSVAECILHIAAAEKELWTMAETALKQPANPEKRAGIKFTDEQLVAAVKDRSTKNKTFAALEPKNSPYKSRTEALSAFNTNRDKLIHFVQSTKSDLRSHVLELPLGTYDAYQFILLIAAHTDRHIQQIEEVKSTSNFPSK